MSMTIHNAYELFKAGHDTFDIAKMTGRPEPEILKEISMCRAALNHLPYPYSPYLTPTTSHTPAPMRRMGMFKTRHPSASLKAERNKRILTELELGRTMDAVAEQFGITKQRVWQITSRARAA